VFEFVDAKPTLRSKRPFLARGLSLDAYWLPVPRQEFVETAGGMTVSHALQDVSEPGKGLDVVELALERA
jgi:hypothetical protein